MGNGCTCKCDCTCIRDNDVKIAKESVSETKELPLLCDFFKNFSDLTRLKIMCVLDNVKYMCVCDIAVALNMTKSAISHQLKYLKMANLVKSQKQGKEVLYSLSDFHVKGIFELGFEHVREGKNEGSI